MRFISLLVAFCFSFNVMASTGTIQELERLMDDYHYSLSVEWDQKDQSFYDSKTKEFFSKLQVLIKERGLSKNDITALVEKKTSNSAALSALTLKLSLLAAGSSVEEMMNIVKESAKDMYSSGASWNGQVIVPVVIGLLVAAAIGYAIWFEVTHECVAWDTRYVCHTYDNCSGGYYDPHYGGYYGGFCGGYYTSCGYTDVCVEYAKKD